MSLLDRKEECCNKRNVWYDHSGVVSGLYSLMLCFEEIQWHAEIFEFYQHRGQGCRLLLNSFAFSLCLGWRSALSYLLCLGRRSWLRFCNLWKQYQQLSNWGMKRDLNPRTNGCTLQLKFGVSTFFVVVERNRYFYSAKRH